MKAPLLVSALLGVSLVANTLLAWHLFFAPPPSSPVVPFPVSSASVIPLPAGVTTRPVGSDPHLALRDRLLRFGLSGDEVRAALRATIEAPRLARQRQLRSLTTPLPWWQGFVVGYRFTPEQEAELRGLRLAEHIELTRLFGRTGAVTPADAEPYLFLPPDRAATLAALERDYRELHAQLAEASPADPGASDSRRRELEREHDRDLAALLSPEERTALDLRSSPTARALAGRLAYFDGTDAELRAVYDLQKSFDEKFPATAIAVVLTGQEPRTLAQARLSTDLAAALGAERYAAWQLSQRNDYRALTDLQRRFDLPPATVAVMTRLPTAASDAAARIGSDPTLTAGEKSSALRQLAADTRTQVRTTLGSALGEAYLTSGGGSWLAPLDRGATFAFTSAGELSSRTVTASPPPSAKSGPP